MLTLSSSQKGTYLLKTDQWKEDFLKEIEDNYKFQIFVENDNYKLMGMPTENRVVAGNLCLDSHPIYHLGFAGLATYLLFRVNP